MQEMGRESTVTGATLQFMTSIISASEMRRTSLADNMKVGVIRKRTRVTKLVPADPGRGQDMS